MLRVDKITMMISKEISFPRERVPMLMKYVKYCSETLDLDNEYTCYLESRREPHGIKTTAICFPENGKFYVYAKDRAFPDILRSIAHEMVHLWQYENDAVETGKLHFASHDEDEANALAGEILNAFGAVIGYDTVYEGKSEKSRKALGS